MEKRARSVTDTEELNEQVPESSWRRSNCHWFGSGSPEAGTHQEVPKKGKSHHDSNALN